MAGGEWGLCFPGAPSAEPRLSSAGVGTAGSGGSGRTGPAPAARASAEDGAAPQRLETASGLKDPETRDFPFTGALQRSLGEGGCVCVINRKRRSLNSKRKNLEGRSLRGLIVQKNRRT